MTQTHAFQTEVQQLLELMIHSLYSEREIFLREMISNASDACDKLRFEALTKAELLAGDDELRVTLGFDAEAGTLTISDNGIGLTEAEAVEHLGTIARSGTKLFAEKLKEANEEDAKNLIGQFGVGFYSGFMVADRIVVESRSAAVSSDEGVRWESSGDGSFETESIARAQRGTSITLHLKDDAKEFLDRFRLQGLVKKYSDYVTHPIMLPKSLSEDEVKEGKEAELEQINAGKPLWTLSKDEISEEQYREFYHGACKQWDEPATRIHFTVEGTLQLTALLFVPSTPPMDAFNRNKSGLALYVRRVFIMDDCEDLLPEYLRFVKGVVDSDDLPLNVSREILQQQGTVTKLRKILVKRILDHLEKLGRSDDAEEAAAFRTIDRHFGPILREGMVNDFDNKDKVAKLARYHSTWTLAQDAPEDEDEPAKTSFAAYIDRKAEGQTAIYYVTGASLDAAKASPHLEGFKKKGFEVLFFVDPVDEWVAGQLPDIDEHKLVSIAKGADELGDDDEKEALEAKSKEFAGFLGFAKESLGDGIKEVRLTNRLTDSPCCLVAEEHGMSTNMEEMLRKFGQDVPAQERILELNPEHPLVQKLQALHDEDSAGGQLGDYIHVLRDQALLAEGAVIKDPAGFARRVQAVMSTALG